MFKSSQTRHLTIFFLLVVLLTTAEFSWGAEISFNQIDWLNESGGYTAQNSEWGMANIQLTNSDVDLFSYTPGVGYQGFVNLSTQLSTQLFEDPNWAVQNLPITFTNRSELSGRLSESMTFDLGISRGSMNLG
jgi:hypothetical protein